MRPIGNKVLIKVDDDQERKHGGIILPATEHGTKPQTGTVLAIGPGNWDIHGKRVPMTVKVDDKVLYGRYAGHEAGNPTKYVQEKQLVMAEEDILLIL